MAETALKREREETQIEEVEENKRNKSLNHILSLLEEEEDIPTQDLSLLMTTLQEELSSDSVSDPVDGQIALHSDEYEHENEREVQSENYFTPPLLFPSASSSCVVKQVEGEEEEEDKEKEFRHLLEASDDELGIPPSREESENNHGCLFIENEGLYCNDGLWEFEDEVANYALLQSELFM